MRFVLVFGAGVTVLNLSSVCSSLIAANLIKTFWTETRIFLAERVRDKSKWEKSDHANLTIGIADSCHLAIFWSAYLLSFLSYKNVMWIRIIWNLIRCWLQTTAKLGFVRKSRFFQTFALRSDISILISLRAGNATYQKETLGQQLPR